MTPKDKRATSRTRRKPKKEVHRTKTKLVLARRPYGYLVGVAILPVATLGFLIGFASPYWHFRKSSSGSTMVHGLWLVCQQVSGELVSCEQTVIRADNWLRGMQFLEVMGLFFLLLACLFVLLLNCTRKDVHSRLLEISSGAGAVFAIFGSLGYLLLTLSPRDSADDLAYNWAFGLNLTGSVLAVIAAILIATNNPPPPAPRKEDRTAVWVKEQGPDKSLQPYRPPSPKMVAFRRGDVVPALPPPPPPPPPPSPPRRVWRRSGGGRNDAFRRPNYGRPLWLMPANSYWPTATI